MFMQRLIIDHNDEFDFDYMGSSEFENGAVRNGLNLFAVEYLKGNITARKMKVFENWGRSTRGPVEMIVFGTKEFFSYQKKSDEIYIVAHQESMRIDNDKYQAWLSVGWKGLSIIPLFMVRANFPNMKLVDELFEGAIEYHQKQFPKPTLQEKEQLV